MIRIACMALVALLAATPAAAQSAPDNEWRAGSTLSGFVGAATAPHGDTANALGGTIGWDLTPRFGIDGRSLWVPSGHGDAFAATLAGRVMIGTARPVLPFVSAGVGFYRATFDTATPSVANFYRRRMMTRESGLRGYAFTDFAATLSAGSDVFLSRHVALRPELSLLVVTASCHARLVPVFGVHLGYHFESRPITP